MEKLLLIGIDTRCMINSALQLDYELYSTSYFSTSDTPTIKNQKIILNESNDESCGIFEDLFSSETLLDISKDYLDEVDYIIPVSGISPTDFPKEYKKKILGTTDIEDIENKYKFYKKIKNKFLTPMTFRLSDIDEAFEINENYPNKQFILKPTQGSGGYNINLLDNSKDLQFNDSEFMLQEFVCGINVSSSVLGTKNDSKTVVNSRLLTMNDFEKNNSFIYVGNIIPLTNESMMENINGICDINEEMSETSQNLARRFNLIGSNGVDYILNENGLYVIELNPRIQGTFECVEKALGINITYIDAWLGLARYEISRDNFAMAQDYLSNAYYIDQNDFRYYYYQGLIYKSQDDYPTAAMYFKKCLKLNPNCVEAQKELNL